MKGKILARIIVFAALLFLHAFNAIADHNNCLTCLTWTPDKPLYESGEAVTVTGSGFPACPAGSICNFGGSPGYHFGPFTAQDGNIQPNYTVIMGQTNPSTYTYYGFGPSVDMGCIDKWGNMTCSFNARPGISLPVGDIQFVSPVVNSNVPLLLHNHRKQYSTVNGYLDPRQTEDLAMPIKVRVIRRSGGTPVAGIPVYFDSVADPPDTSPYRTDAHEGDNTGGLATVIVDGDGKSDADGYITAKLVVPEGAHGGDNYQVKAALDSAFSCGSTCPKSGTITVWKRAYYEFDQMYKVGEFLTKTSTGTKVYVNDASKFRKSGNGWPLVHIFSAENQKGEFRYVASIDTKSKPNVVNLYLSNPLVFSYQDTNPVNPRKECQGVTPGTPFCAVFPYSFIANVDKGVYDSSFVWGDLNHAYADTFVVWNVVDGFNLPAWTSLPLDDPETPLVNETSQFVDERSNHFMKYIGARNHVQLVSAARGAEYDNRSKTSPFMDWSWIFNDVVGMGKQISRTNVVAHELGHQWMAQHDSENAWDGASRCLMNSASDTILQRFHTNPTASTQDLYCIRGHVDDLFQDPDICNWP